MIVALATLLCGILGYVYAIAQPEMYKARREMLVADVGVTQSSAQESERNVATQSATLRSRPVLEEASKRVGGLSVEAISESTTVEALPNSDIIVVAVQRTSEEEARRIVDAITSSYVDNRRAQIAQYQSALDAQLTATQQRIDQPQGQHGVRSVPADVNVQALSGATEFYQSLLNERQQLSVLSARAGAAVSSPIYSDDKPVAPAPLKTAIFAAFFGGLVAAALAALKEQLFPRLRSARLAEERLGVPVLSELGHHAPRDIYAAARSIVFATGVGGDRPGVQVAIIANDDEDTAVAVASEVAKVCSASGKSTALILFRTYGASQIESVELSALLYEPGVIATFAPRLSPGRRGGLRSLDIRLLPKSEASLLSPAFDDFMAHLTSQFASVVVATPPLSASSAGLVTARALKHVVPITRYGQPVSTIANVTAQLQRGEGTVLGLLAE